MSAASSTFVDVCYRHWFAKHLFKLQEDNEQEFLNVVCKIEGFLISFQVDRIGDVMEVESSSFEPTPNTIPENTRRFLSGVYKVSGQLLSIIDIDKVVNYLNETNQEIAA